MSLSRLGTMTNASDKISGQLGLATLFALCSASLAGHVSHVVGLSAKEEMRWVDAERVITAMKNAQPFGNRANHKFIGHTGSYKHPACMATLANLAMPTVLGRATPRYATVGQLPPNTIKETVDERSSRWPEATAILGTESPTTPIDFSSDWMEEFPTAFTVAVVNDLLPRHAECPPNRVRYEVACVRTPPTILLGGDRRNNGCRLASMFQLKGDPS